MTPVAETQHTPNQPRHNINTYARTAYVHVQLALFQYVSSALTAKAHKTPSVARVCSVLTHVRACGERACARDASNCAATCWLADGLEWLARLPLAGNETQPVSTVDHGKVCSRVRACVQSKRVSRGSWGGGCTLCMLQRTHVSECVQLCTLALALIMLARNAATPHTPRVCAMYKRKSTHSSVMMIITLWQHRGSNTYVAVVQRANAASFTCECTNASRQAVCALLRRKYVHFSPVFYGY